MRKGQTIRLTPKRHLWLVAALCITACATTKTPNIDSDTDSSIENNVGKEMPSISVPIEIAEAPVAKPEPAVPPVTPSGAEQPSEPAPSSAPDVQSDTEAGLKNSPDPEIIPIPSGSFSELNLWQTTDPTPAFIAFQKTCTLWKRRSGEKWLNSALPMFGRYEDWDAACQATRDVEANRSNSTRFFQSHFEPVSIGEDTGLLTAYYAPEIPVRRIASLEFSEPILARPTNKKTQTLPRKDLSVTSSTVLAYGKPIDVFFLQIQGSGQIRFPDGTVYRAAFDGHNGHAYTSIGRVLIGRGDMTKDEASKQSIEIWMEEEGYLAAKKLMAENARYVFFKTEHIIPGEGPKGAMGIPLTKMGSLAVDPKRFPYGAVIWVEGRFPTGPGDYTGEDAGHLLVAQDTGGAIKGKKRGDVFFGSGSAAGEKAGVMKHRATWTLFLPIALAMKTLGAS